MEAGSWTIRNMPAEMDNERQGYEGMLAGP